MGNSNPKSFDEITGRLDEIIAQVRSKDTSLERSLDLLDEAIELGSQAVDMVDSLDLSPREEDMLDAAAERDADAVSPGEGADGGVDDGEAEAAAGVGAADGAAGGEAGAPAGD